MGLFSMLSAKKQQKQEAKADIMREALSEIFVDCTYKADGTIPGETVRDAGLIDQWDKNCDGYNTKMWFRFTGNDYFSGSYQGCGIECCNVEITKYWTVLEKDEDGNEQEREELETSFKGLWMICKLQKPLRATIRIREKEDTPLLFRKFAGKRINAKSDVETENTAFNEQFQILTSDEHSAFYLLTPHFMECILSVDGKANGRTMLCFSSNQAHIAIHTGKEAFATKKDAELRNPEVLKQRIQGELQYVTRILDDILQNENLF